jgi:polyhydroxyalkanoate synthesis regulator protein
MGSFLEKNIQTFIELQQRLQEQSRALYGDNPMLMGEAWTQFLKMQGPAIQALMSSYLEQSANAFFEMQTQLQRQTRNLFGAFPFSGFSSGGATQAPPSQPPEEQAGGSSPEEREDRDEGAARQQKRS